MPIIKHTPQDHTGRECWVFDGKEWKPAIVTGPDQIKRVPFFNLSGYSELPITPVRLFDGREIDAGCFNMVWNKPNWID